MLCTTDFICDKPYPPSNIDVYPYDSCDFAKAREVFDRYKKAYGGEIQGLCLIIADETQKTIGGDVVAGYLWMCGIQRPHWWVEKDGTIYDFMGDEYQKELNFHRSEEHRNKDIFESVLPRYERYRLW